MSFYNELHLSGENKTLFDQMATLQKLSSCLPEENRCYPKITCNSKAKLVNNN